MEQSANYIALETMIRGGWLPLDMSEIEEHLSFLEKQEVITAIEHQALLTLAEQVRNDIVH